MKHLFSLFAIALMSVAVASAQQCSDVVEQVSNETYTFEKTDALQAVSLWSDAAGVTEDPTQASNGSIVKYHSEGLVGFSCPIGPFEYPPCMIYLHTIQGVRVGKYFSAGVGVGLSMLYNFSQVFLPIYLNLKGYLPVGEKTSLFLSFDVGGSFGLSMAEVFSGVNTFMLSPALGVSLNNKVNISLGYELTKITDGSSSVKMNGLALKVGCIF